MAASLSIVLAACLVVQAGQASGPTPEQLAGAACARVRSLFDAGRWDEAETEARRVVAAIPDSVTAAVLFGTVRSANGARPEELVAIFTRACALDPKSFDARLQLGRALLRADRTDDAITALDAAVGLDPSRVEAHYQLARALRRAGRDEAAAREFATVDRHNEAARAMSNGMGGPAPRE